MISPEQLANRCTEAGLTVRKSVASWPQWIVSSDSFRTATVEIIDSYRNEVTYCFPNGDGWHRVTLEKFIAVMRAHG